MRTQIQGVEGHARLDKRHRHRFEHTQYGDNGRPGLGIQQNHLKVYFLRNKGFIDDYMWQHGMNKKSSNAKVPDFRENDFEGWTHWKDFTTKMPQDKALIDEDQKIEESVARTHRIEHAFVSPDRRGGTENTIHHARELNVPVVIHHPAGSI